MNIVYEFITLCLGQKRMTFDSQIPSFCILTLICNMEKQGIIAFNTQNKIVISRLNENHTGSYGLLADIIFHNELTSIYDILNYFLRGFTFNELKVIINAITEEMCKTNNAILSKGKLCVNDEAIKKSAIRLTALLINDNNDKDGLTIASMLYGCNILNKYLDKNEYCSTVAVIKNGIHISHLPITSFIINNIELISGHIMGIISN